MGQTILLVEDVEADVFFFRRALSRLGSDVSVRVVSNGAEAQRYMEGQPPYDNRNYFQLPSLIVCDFKMPRRTGADFLEWLRQCRHFDDISFVLFSGSVLLEEEELAMKLGANLYLRKSGDFADMLDRTRNILELLEPRRNTAPRYPG